MSLTTNSRSRTSEYPVSQGDETQAPLRGVTVVDMTTSYAGPTATMYLADLGADVIKVERPGSGDDCREWGPPFRDGWSAWYVSANRNKRSICLDISSEEGRALLDRLLARADVFVQSLNPSKLRRLHLHPEQIRSSHPHLIYCAISGFGLTGEDQALPGYDLIAQARSGLMSVTGEAGGMPQRVSTALSDIATGITAALAISAALVGRGSSPAGRTIDVSLLDVDLALMAPRIAAFSAGDPEPYPSGATDSVLAIYQTFETADRPIVVAVGNDRMWQKLCALVDLGELAGDSRFLTNEGRRQHRVDIVAKLQSVLVRRTAAEWIGLLTAGGIPVSPINFLSDVVNDPHVRSRKSITTIDIDGAGPFSVVNHPWRLDGTTTAHRAPKRLGEDTDEVLRWVGVDDAEIEEFTRAGVVWQHEFAK